MIVDTMVMAYAMLGVPEFGEESANALAAMEEIAAPASVEAELLNVVWQWGRHKGTPEVAASAYFTASRLWTELIAVDLLWPEALELALSAGHSPYDTLFVAAARLRKTLVVTYDKKLLEHFPEDTTTVRRMK
jgi:Predicted nucleic acid-binding protein, contains PIN domain